jgi:hypothetical protein
LFLLKKKGNIINVTQINTYDVKVKDYLQYKGYALFLSNNDIDIKKCYDNYIRKDAVEKSFHNFKGYLGLERPYVHGSTRLVNKSFILMMAQILYCQIHKIMLKKDQFSKFSIPILFQRLKSIKYIKINDFTRLKPLTKKQKEIFDIFEVSKPTL